MVEVLKLVNVAVIDEVTVGVTVTVWPAKIQPHNNLALFPSCTGVVVVA